MYPDPIIDQGQTFLSYKFSVNPVHNVTAFLKSLTEENGKFKCADIWITTCTGEQEIVDLYDQSITTKYIQI